MLAAVGLAAFALFFARETASFRAAVVEWATRDLQTRTTLAAATLREPLETGDFRRIHAFGETCSADGVRLTVFTAPGGLFFDSLRAGTSAPDALYASAKCGEYTVRLGLPRARVLAPFERAKTGFWLAALLGGAGVLLVFYFTYRQRVRIRELKRLEAFRRDFIADVSHEIKTPLTGILGAVDLLDDGEAVPPEGRRKLLGLVRKESVRLNALAQNILSLARLERAGETGTLRRETADLAALAAETVERFAPKADAAGVALALDAEGPLPYACDAQLVSQALANLVENALRHASARHVAVSAKPHGKGVCLAVTDDGAGIPAEHAARVFERFHRVDAARAAETGGAGLGLAIVRGIARLHGGDAALEAVKPHGCRFTVSLP